MQSTRHHLHDDGSDEDFQDINLYLGRKPALFGTVDSKLHGLGNDDYNVVITSRPPLRHSLDLNSVVEEENLRSSFSAALQQELVQDHKAPSYDNGDAYQEELLLNVPKLGAMLNITRTKGSNYYGKAQEIIRKRLEAAYSPRSPRSQSSEGRMRSPSPGLDTLPFCKPLNLANRTRPKSMNAANRTLRELAGESSTTEDNTSPIEKEKDTPAVPTLTDLPTLTATLAEQVAAQFAAESPRASISETPLQTGRDPSIAIESPSLGSVSFVRQMKAIPPPTFVSVCLPAVPAANASSQATLQPNPSIIAENDSICNANASRRGVPAKASIPNNQILPDIQHSSSHPIQPSVSPTKAPGNLLLRVNEMLHKDEGGGHISNLVFPDDLQAHATDYQRPKSKQTKRARSAGTARRARDSVDVSSLCITPSSGAVPQSILTLDQHQPAAPARREVHSSSGVSPRLRGPNHPFPAGFKPVSYAPHAKPVARGDTDARPLNQTLDQFFRSSSPGGQPRSTPIANDIDSLSPKTKVLLLAHQIAQELPDRTRYRDVPVSVVSAPEHLQRLIYEETKRHNRAMLEVDHDGAAMAVPSERGVSITLPPDLIQAMDRQLKRYSGLQRQPAIDRHSPTAEMGVAASNGVDDDMVEAIRNQLLTASIEEKSYEGQREGEGEEATLGDNLVLRWRAFLATPHNNPIASTSPVQTAPMISEQKTGTSAVPNTAVVPLPVSVLKSQPGSRSGSRPSTGRRTDFKVLQFDANALEALFKEPDACKGNPSGAGAVPGGLMIEGSTGTSSWVDEDYMNVHELLAEYHDAAIDSARGGKGVGKRGSALASNRRHNPDQAVKLNPTAPSQRLGSPAKSGRQLNGRNAKQHEADVDNPDSVAAMQVRPVCMLPRRPVLRSKTK